MLLSNNVNLPPVSRAGLPKRTAPDRASSGRRNGAPPPPLLYKQNCWLNRSAVLHKRSFPFVFYIGGKNKPNTYKDSEEFIDVDGPSADLQWSHTNIKWNCVDAHEGRDFFFTYWAAERMHWMATSSKSSINGSLSSSLPYIRKWQTLLQLFCLNHTNSISTKRSWACCNINNSLFPERGKNKGN